MEEPKDVTERQKDGQRETEAETEAEATLAGSKTQSLIPGKQQLPVTV